VRTFALYSVARLGIFVVAFGLVWAVAFAWLTWDQLTVLWTALVALVVSAVVSYWLLGGLRDALAHDIDARARRLRSQFDDARRAEDH